MRYYEVIARRGHCGAGNYMPIRFAFYAVNISDAVELARKMPGVKHHLFIISAKEITFDEYVTLRKSSAYERLERMEDHE